ncbi:PqqD family protein [Plantactinospora sp. GCM10030261]|uniref:PqqD family protein n=1 Tax=Plantactinospora sp. GCM10030261 TaxID=3273420 RepID=UPI00362183CB
MTTDQHEIHRIAGPQVAWRAAGDEVVILDTVNAVYFGLDRSASLLWHRLVAGATVAELVATLVANAPVDEARAAADVHTFLEDLRRNGLLRSA